MEVTNELLTKIYGLYIGCQVRVKHQELANFNFTDTLIGIQGKTLGKVESRVQTKNGAYAYPFDACKLLLKPLSSITDEDAIEVAKIMGSSMEEHVKLGWIALVHDMLYKGIAKPVLGSNITYIVADYLRSKSYALPYMGIDLFASGIATSSTLTDKSK